MFERLEAILARYEQLNQQLMDPEVVKDIKRLTSLSKEQSDLSKIVDVYREYKDISEQIEELKEVIKEDDDPEIVELAEVELEELKERLPQLEEELTILLLPKDPNYEKKVIVEIRGAPVVMRPTYLALRMYTKYAESKNWKIEVLNIEHSDVGGIAEVQFMVSGDSVYSHLKYESGAHRVQRVPQTESQGRIHIYSNRPRHARSDDVEVEVRQEDIRSIRSVHPTRWAVG